MAKHMIPFGSTQNGERELIELAFSKKKADDRKEWLRQFRVRLLFLPQLRYAMRVRFIDRVCSPAPTSITTRTKFRIPISSTGN